MSDVDVRVLRASREQYEAEEAERERKNRMDLIREQHRKYEESLQRQQGEETKKAAENASAIAITSASSSAATTASAAAAVVESNIVEPPVQQQSTHWRNVIGSGNVPKINKDAEFPSLGGGDASKLMSLAELGATISASSSNSRFNFII